MNRRAFIQRLSVIGASLVIPITWTYKKAKRIFTGRRVRVFVNGQEVGFMKEPSFSYKSEPIHTLGRFEITEITDSQKDLPILTRGIVVDDG